MTSVELHYDVNLHFLPQNQRIILTPLCNEEHNRRSKIFLPKKKYLHQNGRHRFIQFFTLVLHLPISKIGKANGMKLQFSAINSVLFL